MNYRHEMRQRTITLTALAIFLAGCSSDPVPKQEPSATTVATEGDVADGVVGTTTGTQPTPPGGAALVPCDSFDGQDTIDVANFFQSGEPCGRDIGLAELETFFGGIASEDCADGTALYWNDTGWGPSNGTWTVTSEGLPPDVEFTSCRGE